MAELPNPVNLDAACKTVRPEDVGAAVPHGLDPQPYLEALGKFADAGFDHLSIVPVGDDLDGFLKFWTDEIAPEAGKLSTAPRPESDSPVEAVIEPGVRSLAQPPKETITDSAHTRRESYWPLIRR